MALRTIMLAETDDVLRKKSKTVTIVTPAVATLLADMAETMYHANGAGLAAPQVGILRRAIVIDVGEGLLQLVNPRIEQAHGEVYEEEGCLSVPGVRGIVVRPARVVASGLGIDGTPVKIHAEGLLARALCHEIDNLEGVLFTDKVEPGTLTRILQGSDSL